jgi:hypothetical protein
MFKSQVWKDISVLVFCGCCNEVPQIGWLKQHATVLLRSETEIKVCLGWSLYQGQSLPSVSSSCVSQHSWACSFVFILCLHIFFCECLSVPKCPSIGVRANLSPHLNLIICKETITRKITFLSTGMLGLQNPWGVYYLNHNNRQCLLWRRGDTKGKHPEVKEFL